MSEVALAVYFTPPLHLRSVDVGQLYERWRANYPITADQPLLPPVPPESFDEPPLGSVAIHLGLQAGTRVWFQTEQGDHLVQLQPDRLVLNWRRVDPDGDYPRYGSLRPTFARLFDDVRAACGARGHEALVTHAEVAYTNPIPRNGMAVSDVLAPWSGEHHDTFLPPEEEVALNFRYRIPDPTTGKPCGRLYASFAPTSYVHPGAIAPSDTFLFQVFARGATAGDPQPERAFSFLDLGHDWVVNGFVTLTTTRMHKLWGLMDEDRA